MSWAQIYQINVTFCQSSWAHDELSKMSLRQKIGQLFVVAAASNFNQPGEILANSMAESPYNMQTAHVEKLIVDYGVGGVIFLYKSDPIMQINLTKKFQNLARVPLLITQDSEWGLAMRLDINPSQVVLYPRNMTLGAIEDEQLIYKIAKEIGQQCAAIGVHMNFAPVADVNNNKMNPVIGDRSFGDDPDRVAKLVKLFSKGLHDGGVLSCAKHFPGHGDTKVDSHLELPVLNHDLERLNQVELVPFIALIKEHIPALMHAHLAIPKIDNSGNPSSLSYIFVTKLLQNKLKFTGLNITDGLGMLAVRQKYAPGYLELEAFLAGNDILLCPLDVPLAIDLIEKAILENKVREQELDRRVLKILQAKYWALTRQKQAPENVLNYLMRKEACDLQIAAYRAAITLIVQGHPVAFNQDTLNQSYLIEIDGKSEDDFSDLLLACKNHETIIITLSGLNKFAAQNFGISSDVFSLIKQLKKMNKKIVLALFGTPYALELFTEVDMIIVAYEDLAITKQAVLDVLNGSLVSKGRLPINLKKERESYE